MTWFKVDDNFAFHPKAIAATPNSLALWVRAGAWCAGQLTDGFVPTPMIAALGGRRRDADRLVEVGLWRRVEPVSASRKPAGSQPTTSRKPADDQPEASDMVSEPSVSKPSDGGYQFVDWSDWQPTKAQVRAERDATKKRVQEFRARKSNGVGNGERNGVTNGVSTPAPTRPDPTSSTSGTTEGRAKRGTRIPEDFAVTDEMVAWAREKTPGVDGRRETEKFIDYWAAKSGATAAKTDWVATWRNWMRTAYERNGGNVSPIHRGSAEDPNAWMRRRPSGGDAG